MKSDHQPRTEQPVDGSQGRLVTCRVDELQPHPSYVRHHLTVSASQLSALADRGERAFREPIVITQNRQIVDGYARWELAQLQHRPTLPCIEYELSEVEALHLLLQRHCRSNGLNDFCRILLALELEPSLREKSLANQRLKAQNEGSSNLTEAERLDVRSEIASAADVSAGNVTKVKQLMSTAHPELLQALRGAEISIHRAWLWRALSPEEQKEALRSYQDKRGIKKIIRTLISRHRPKSLQTILDLGDLAGRLSALQSKLGPINVALIEAPGKTVFVTEELLQALRAQEELILTCAINSC